MPLAGHAAPASAGGSFLNTNLREHQQPSQSRLASPASKDAIFSCATLSCRCGEPAASSRLTMGAAVRPEETSYVRAFKDVNSHVSLDAAWAKVRVAIESHCGLLGKQHSVRVRNWLKKLSEEVSGEVG